MIAKSSAYMSGRRLCLFYNYYTNYYAYMLKSIGLIRLYVNILNNIKSTIIYENSKTDLLALNKIKQYL